MMNYPLRNFLLFIFLLPGYALADIAVLIHGYHSSGYAWRTKGITALLASNGWNDAGSYTPLGNLIYFGQPLTATGKHLITSELPSEAPVEIQASLLSQYLDKISRLYPQQKIHLVAHSAGGIVARLALVNNYAQSVAQSSAQKYTQKNKYNVVQLITIATPHLGSPIAEMAEAASDTPIGFFAPLIGASELNRAQILYKQLSGEDENQFLFWLNRQAHPPMSYTSIIRANDSFLKGDWLVPSQSQNMAFVPAIGRNAKIILSPGKHPLKYADGFLLLNLLP